jgi:hypothetical protein
MRPRTEVGTGKRSHGDGTTPDGHSTLGCRGSALVVLALVAVAVFLASPVAGASPSNEPVYGSVEGPAALTTPTAVADCTVSETSVQVGESVILDASASDHADDFQYDRYGGSSFGEYTTQSSRAVSYAEPGTYEPRVKVWSYSDGENSDIATCGTVTVTEPTPTPTPTPAPSPVASCTVSETNVQVGESVTLDASASDHADDFQYDRYGGSSFGQYTAQSSRTVAYSEPGTYEPRVKVWSYSDGERSDVDTCGTVTVTESTPTPTPTPAPTAVADCTVSETSVQVGESVTLDASGSEHADDFQYDRYGGTSFGQYTAQSSRTVSYAEPGTYEPRVKVWSYSGSESSDIATCGTVTVTEPTPTPTPTPAPSAVASCTVSETNVQVGESVTLDASASDHADDFQYDRYGGSSFGEYTTQSSRAVAYSEPGTYEPRVKVWSYSGSESSDIATCGTVTVTESTPTLTPPPTATRTETATSSSEPTSTPRAGGPGPSTPTATAVPTTTGPAGTETPTPAPGTSTRASATGTAAGSGTWFQYESSGNDSVTLLAQPAVSRDAVETYGWDVDGDGTVDRQGRTLELHGTTGAETAVTLQVERADGSTASVTRDVPVTALAGGTAAPDRAVTAADADDGPPVPALLGLLLLVLVFVLAALVVARSQQED